MVAANSEQIAKMENILEQLDHVAPTERDDNRRGAPRLNVRLALTAIILGSVTPWPIQIYTRNISVSGIAFVSHRMFKENERIAIHLKVTNLPARLVLARVTFGRYVSAGLYEMGAEFLECLKGQPNAAIPGHWLGASTAARLKMGPQKASERALENPPEKPAAKAPEPALEKAVEKPPSRQ